MPVYEYACPGCGGFEASRPAAHAGEPVACPACGAPAPRRYGPPNLVRTPAPLAAAKERSERSAYEPKVVSGPPFGAAARAKPHAHRHGPPWALH